MELLDFVHDILDLQSAQSLLGWDQDTHMPSGGAEGRARAIATLEKEVHRKLVDPRLLDLAKQAEGSPDEVTKEIGRYWRESHEDALKVPESLVTELAEQASLGNSTWHEATKFEEVLPFLDSLVKLNRQYAACYPEYRTYDALIDGFDPGLTQGFIDKAFGILKPGLLALRAKATPSEVAPKSVYTTEIQLMGLCRQVTEWMGFRYSAGNLAKTEHPFMSPINKRDVRIATKLLLTEPLHTITGAVHEAGHALYEQNRGYEDTGLDALESSALHESQSLFWEVMYGKSEFFWDRWFPDFQKATMFKHVTAHQVIGELRRYDPSNVIRLRAGDLDYGLHILLRYELERDLFESGLEAKDMKARFNELCVTYFGREPTDDRREGVMQDVHWHCGLFGYFPSYLLGVSFAAQLWEKAPKAHDPTLVLAYLRENVHQHGGRYTFEELTDKLGGYNPNAYLAYLRNAYNLTEG